MTLIYLGCGWVAGIVIAAIVQLPTAVWLIQLVIPSVSLFFWRHDELLRRANLVLLAFILGALRFQLAQTPPEDIPLTELNNRGQVSLIGIVVDDPIRQAAHADLMVDVNKVKKTQEWQALTGRALVQVSRDTPIRFGDEIQVDGEPRTPPDGADFSYRDFLARKKIFTEVRYATIRVISHGHGNIVLASLYDIKSSALASVRELFPEPSAALLSGILLGDAHDLPADVSDAFKNTNTAHIIAISGFNISILALYLGKVAPRLVGKRLTAPFVVTSLVLYTLLVGAGASVVRAAIMGVLAVLALAWGRQAYALTSLAAAAIVMTLLNPFSLWDLGFQLSFMATLGLLLYTERLTSWFSGALSRLLGVGSAKSALSFVSDSLIVTVAAQIATTPLIMADFQRVSIVGLLTNFLVLPAQPGVEILGGLATIIQLLATAVASVPIASIVLSGSAHAVAAAAYVFLQYTILIVEWTAQIPFGSFDLPRIDPGLVFLLYALIIVASSANLRGLLRSLFSRPAWAIALLALSVVIAWSTSLAVSDSRTHLQFIASSAGDAILIRTANGGRILLDGSTEPSAVLGKLGEVTTFWDRHLDLVAATNLDEPNLASLNAVLERYSVGQVLEPPAPDRPTSSYGRWRKLLADKSVPSFEARAGTQLRIDDITIDVLFPGQEDKSTNVALRASTGAQSLLLAPSLHSADLNLLLASQIDLASNAAVLPSEFDQGLLTRVSPQTVIIFVGQGSRAQPTFSTLKLLQGVDLWRTDEHGTVELVFDQTGPAISSER